MNNLNYLTGLIDSIPDLKKIVLLMFLNKKDVNCLYECGFLKGDIKFQYVKNFKVFYLN